MTYVAIIYLALFIGFLLCALFWVNSQFPTADEEKQAKRDVEEMLKRANRETQDRRRVRAGNQWSTK